MSITTTDSTAGPTKVDHLWFEDADVVFKAGKKMFRVHRSILSARSTVFSDMFSIPQDPQESSQKEEDNVTVIELPDAGDDVQFFFWAIFDASFYSPPPSKYPLETTVSILRLALKYDTPFLKRRAIAHLDSFFPLDKAKLDEMINNQKSLNIAKLQLFIDIIPLAGLSDAQWIFPSLLYILVSQWSTTKIMEQSNFRELSPNLQAITMQFRELYALDMNNRNGWIGMLPSELCSDEDQCAPLSRWVQNQHHSRTMTGRILPPLKAGDAMTKNGKMFCRQCQAVGKAHQKKLADLYWNKYPTFCGFGKWDDLKKIRHVSINA